MTGIKRLYTKHAGRLSWCSSQLESFVWNALETSLVQTGTAPLQMWHKLECGEQFLGSSRPEGPSWAQGTEDVQWQIWPSARMAKLWADLCYTMGSLDLYFGIPAGCTSSVLCPQECEQHWNRDEGDWYSAVCLLTWFQKVILLCSVLWGTNGSILMSGLLWNVHSGAKDSQCWRVGLGAVWGCKGHNSCYNNIHNNTGEEQEICKKCHVSTKALWISPALLSCSPLAHWICSVSCC